MGQGASRAAAAAQAAAQATREQMEHAAAAGLAAASKAKGFLSSHISHGAESAQEEKKSPPRIEPLGIRAAFITAFIEENGGRSKFEGLSTSEVCTQFILPFTLEGKCSVTETLRNKGRFGDVGFALGAAGEPEIMQCPHVLISHMWAHNFLKTVDAITNFIESRGLKPEEFILWMDLFCDQHHDRTKRQVEIMQWFTLYRFHISRIKHVVIVIDEWKCDGSELNVLSRAWCAFELYCARISGCRLDIVLDPSAEEKFVAVLRERPEETIKAFQHYNSASSLSAGHSVDAAAIAGLFETNVKFDRLDKLIKVTYAEMIENEIERRLQNATEESEKADWKLAFGRLKVYMAKPGKNDGLKDISAALEIRTKLYGKDDEKTVEAGLMMALYYRQHNLHDKAVDFLNDAYEARCRRLGEDDQKTLCILNNFAASKILIKEMARGEDALERCLAGRRRKLGNKHPDTLDSLNNLATNFIENQNWAQAAEHLNELQTLRKDVFGPKHPDTLSCIQNYAVCLDKLGKCKEALSLLEPVLEAQIEFANSDPPYDQNTLQTMFNMATCLEKLGRMEEARDSYERCLQNRMVLLGNDSPDTLTTQAQLASVYYRLKDSKTALHMYEDCSSVQRRVLGKYHKDTLVTLNNMAIIYSDIHLYHRALPICQEVYLAQAAAHGLHHKDTLGAMANLGIALFKVGDYKTACPVVEQCLELRMRYLGPDHPDTCSSMNNLAFVYESMGDDETAYTLLEHCLFGRRKILGDHHPETQSSASHLIEFYRKVGAYDKIIALRHDFSDDEIKNAGDDVKLLTAIANRKEPAFVNPSTSKDRRSSLYSSLKAQGQEESE